MVEFRPHRLQQKTSQFKNAKISEIDYINKQLIKEIIEKQIRNIVEEEDAELQQPNGKYTFYRIHNSIFCFYS